MTTLLIDVFMNKIWVKIKFRRHATADDSDGWTPVHLHLLSVPELCHMTSQFSSSLSSSFQQWLLFRREHPLQFFIVNTYICLNFAIVGCYIPGIVVSYLIGISVLLSPCLIYYRVPHKIYKKLEPGINRVCYVLSYFSIFITVFRAIRGDCGNNQPGIVLAADGTSDDLNLDDLCPDTDTAMLSAAASESEGEETPGPSTPALSENQSIENSEDEGHESDLEQDLAEGLGEEMPSFDDHTDDELLDSKSLLPDSMQFVPTHFEDSDSDDEGLSHNLKFSEVTPKGRDDIESERNIAGQLVAQAMGSMMKAAFQGLSSDTDNSNNDSSNSYAPRKSHKSKSSQKKTEYETTTVKPKNKKGRNSVSLEDYLEQSDTELADDFEFLDPTELEDVDNSTSSK